MPSVSGKQHRFMEGIAHGMKPKGKGPSVAVAKEFVAADTGKHFGGKRHPQSHAEFHKMGHPKSGKY